MTEAELATIGARGRPELIKYYESKRQKLKGEDLFILGKCYVEEKRFEEAQQAFRDYIEGDPRDGRGWLGLGNTFVAMERWRDAIGNCEKAEALGESDAVRMLGACFLAVEDFKGFQQFAPKLLRYAKEQPMESDERYEVVAVALSASLALTPPDSALFLSFVDLLPVDQSHWPTQVRDFALKGFRLFGTPNKYTRKPPKLACND